MKLVGTQSLETKNLLLRRLKISDYKEAYESFYKDKEVAKYSLWDEHKSNEFTRKLFEIWYKEYKNLDVYRWLIVLRDSNEIIGMIDSQVNKYEDYGAFELGYSLSKKYWNNNYMTEAIKKIIEFFMEDVEANVVYAECMSDNTASERVMQKVGMIKEGVLKNRVITKEKKVNDLISYSITKEDYYKKKMVKK